MTFHIRFVSFLVVSFYLSHTAHGREWSDKTGEYAIEADLVAFDDEHVVLQREDQELGIVDIADLSDKDRAYLESKEAETIHDENMDQMQTWTTNNGLKLVGRLVDYARGDVVIQRRRGRMYVNDRAFDNLPSIYQKLVPIVIEHFEDVELPDERALQRWLRRLGGEPRSFLVEGVILELESGDEYAIPFFVFSASDRRLLKAGWREWLAVENDYQQRADQAFRLETLAAARSKNEQIDRQIALMDLNLQAIRAGITSAWEVTLYPAPGNASPPRWVVVPGRNSAQATAAAVQNNPGFVAGPARRISR